MDQSLIFCFFAALNIGLVSAKVSVVTVAKGENATLLCYLTLFGDKKFFCKNQCEEENILIKTDAETAVNGRYSINYKNPSSGRGILSVTINNMVKSDSGIYRCGLGKTLPVSYFEFEFRVSDKLRDKNAGVIRTLVVGETLTHWCFIEGKTEKKNSFFFCKGGCKKQGDPVIETDHKNYQSERYSIGYDEGSTFGLYVGIDHVTKSDTGWYKCGYGKALSPDSFYTFNIMVIEAPGTFNPTTTLPSTSPSVPSTFQATTQTLSATSFPAPPETTDQLNDTGFLLPLVVFVSLVVVSLLVLLLVLIYKRKTRENVGENTRRNTDRTKIELSVTYENFCPSHKCDENI